MQILSVMKLHHLRDSKTVYTRENKPRLSLAAAYIIRDRNLYEYKLPGQDKPRLEKAMNVDFVPFTLYTGCSRLV